MKKIYLLASLMFLVSCNKKVENISSSSSTLSSSTTISSTSNNVDYTLFDTNLIGTWYVHSNMSDSLPINTPFEIFANYTLEVQNIKFNFVGLYAGFEGACEFISESGITTFVVSCDGEYADWAYSDLGGNQDTGTAKKTPVSEGLQYDYVGPNWPMELVNEYLELEGAIPSFPSDSYSLWRGLSAMYDDAKSCMIDIFNAGSKSAENYIKILQDAGYIFEEKDSVGFYCGHDTDCIYALRIIYFSSDHNLSILIYNYDTVY